MSDLFSSFKSDISVKDSHTKNNEFTEDGGLKILTIILFIGILAIIFVSIFSSIRAPEDSNGFWPVLGLSLSIALAATICGGFLGFLFGVPRSLQKNNDVVVQNNNVGNISKTQKPYSNNTNLEEISDWLTKIIVGVSLIQLGKLKLYFNELCIELGKSYSGFLLLKYGSVFSGSIILFFSIAGFLIVYLWARIYLLEQLFRKEKEMNDYWSGEFERKFELKINKEVLKRKIEEFNKERSKIVQQESNPTFKPILDIAKPGPMLFLNDCQKGRWGESPISGSFKASAEFSPDSVEPDRFHVKVILKTDNPLISPLEGDVYFFLHDTYYPYCIVTKAANNNEAILEIDSYEAFTIGIVFNGGNGKVELDLNLLSNAPQEFIYAENLPKIDELRAELEKITESET